MGRWRAGRAKPSMTMRSGGGRPSSREAAVSAVDDLHECESRRSTKPDLEAAVAPCRGGRPWRDHGGDHEGPFEMGEMSKHSRRVSGAAASPTASRGPGGAASDHDGVVASTCGCGRASAHGLHDVAQLGGLSKSRRAGGGLHLPAELLELCP